MENLSIDIFMKIISSLPFTDVINLCSVNKTFHNYSTNIRYNNHWKKLTDDIYLNSNLLSPKDLYIDNYQIVTFNYLVYVKLVQKLDKISQAIIYFQKGDMKNFDNFENDEIKILALFLLAFSDKSLIEIIRKYIKHDDYSSIFIYNNENSSIFLDLLNGQIPDDDFDIREIMYAFADYDNVNGIKFIEKKYGSLIDVVIPSSQGSLNAVKYLFEKNKENIETLNRAFYHACDSGHFKIIKFLVEKIENIDIDEGLCLACQNGHLEVIKFLIGIGANIHFENESPLINACFPGYLETVKYLVERGADNHIDDNKPMYIAIEYGYFEMVKYLVENGFNTVESIIGSYISGLNIYPIACASGGGHLEIVKYLVEKGADINASKGDALISACFEGHLEVVKYLVENGADIQSDENLGLCWASDHGHLEIVKYLIEKGADVNDRNGDALISACIKGNLDIVKYLVENSARCNINKALKKSIKRGHLDIINYLTDFQETIITDSSK